MRRTRVISIIVMLALLMTSFSFSQTTVSYVMASEREAVYSLSEQLAELEEFIKFLYENFKDEVDFETLINGVFAGVLKALDDPYSAFFPNREAAQEAPEMVTGEYGGIGVQIETATLGRRAGQTWIIDVLEGTPADRAGLRPGDFIVSVDGKDVTSLLSVEVARLLRGQVGSIVSVVVDRGRYGTHTFLITRERITLTGSFVELKDENVGYIKLSAFGSATSESFLTAKTEMIKAGATSLIIDLRNNPGGIIYPAVEIAAELLEKGYILHIRQSGEIIQTVTTIEGPRNIVPMVILVNEGTASAAEILAAALQDNNVAIIVGTQTSGKGTAQTLRQLPGGQTFRFSIFEFLRPNKESIEGIGITPDYIVRNSLGERRYEAAIKHAAFAPFIEETRPVAGDMGIDVFAAQQRLRLLGYDIELTAVMDDATVYAITEFQRKTGLWPGGVLDFTTRARIEAAVLSYINNESEEDLQLLKAIELLRQ